MAEVMSTYNMPHLPPEVNSATSYLNRIGAKTV